jgi:hypothetical protein
MATRKTLYLSDTILEKIEAIASKNRLLSEKGNIDYSKAILHAIKEYPLSDKPDKLTEIQNDLAALSEKIEQVNVMMPHLFFQGNFTSRISSARINDGDYKKLSHLALEQTAKVCGQIQKQNYSYLALG